MIPDVWLWQLKLLLRRLSRDFVVLDSAQYQTKCVSTKNAYVFPAGADPLQVEGFVFNERAYMLDGYDSTYSKAPATRGGYRPD